MHAAKMLLETDVAQKKWKPGACEFEMTRLKSSPTAIAPKIKVVFDHFHIGVKPLITA